MLYRGNWVRWYNVVLGAAVVITAVLCAVGAILLYYSE